MRPTLAEYSGMIFIRNLQILSVFTILLPTICYAAALEPLWKPFPGQRDVGGCDADLQNLRQSYQQALLLVQAAIDAFGNIEKSKPADAKGAQTWDRQARMAKAMFDIEADPNSGIPQSQRVIENQVSSKETCPVNHNCVNLMNRTIPNAETTLEQTWTNEAHLLYFKFHDIFCIWIQDTMG